jgi:CheY-like chemotaxis protein
VAAVDGTRALECAEAEQPAAIVLDVMMPGRDGWEVLQVLKSHPATRHIPVVVCSVLQERDLALALGAAELLVKPVARPDLLRALGRHSLGSPAGRQD